MEDQVAMTKWGFTCAWLAGLFVLLQGCTEAPFFEENHVIESSEWPVNRTEVFTFQVEDTTQAFDFYFNLRHGENYPYRNLYLFVQLDFPNGKKSVDTLECLLADSRGKWSGRTTGQYVDHRIQFQQRRIFPLKGNYHLRVRQGMRVDPLPAVHDFGFALEYWKDPN